MFAAGNVLDTVGLRGSGYVLLRDTANPVAGKATWFYRCFGQCCHRKKNNESRMAREREREKRDRKIVTVFRAYLGHRKGGI